MTSAVAERLSLAPRYQPFAISRPRRGRSLRSWTEEERDSWRKHFEEEAEQVDAICALFDTGEPDPPYPITGQNVV